MNPTIFLHAPARRASLAPFPVASLAPFRVASLSLFRVASLALSFVALVSAAHVDARAQTPSSAQSGNSGRARPAETYPGFADYPAGAPYTGRPAPVVLRTRRDRMFRSQLREAAKGGPNFAGRYTAVHWGCGTGCAQLAVIDAVTGLVYWPPLEFVDIPSPDGGEYGPGYRLDSKLLVLTRSHYDREAGYTAYYYLFDRNRFRLVRRAGRKARPIENEDPPGDDSSHDNHH